MLAASSNGTVDQMRVQPTPQLHHKRIGRVKHSESAAPLGQGAVTARSITYPATDSIAVAALVQD